MPQRQDLDVLIPITHRKKTQDSKRVHHRQVRQPQEHNRSSCRSNRFAAAPMLPSAGQDRRRNSAAPMPLTCTDMVFGKRSVLFRPVPGCLKLVGYSGAFSCRPGEGRPGRTSETGTCLSHCDLRARVQVPAGQDPAAMVRGGALSTTVPLQAPHSPFRTDPLTGVMVSVKVSVSGVVFGGIPQ